MRFTNLAEYDRIKPRNANKFNVLGGRSGDRGQLMPTYTDLIDPDNWLVITELGEQALQTGALDDLDAMLLGLHSTDDLLKMRYGAYEAVTAQNTDWQRHAATSCRELVTKVLHTIAPDSAVRADPQFVANPSASSGITRKQRIKYYLRQKRGSASSSDIAVIEKACNLVEACHSMSVASRSSNATLRLGRGNSCSSDIS